MEKTKTVKEVCELTGLNSKLLYLYDHQGIVKPTTHKNFGHEGTARKSGVKVNYSGYKLYNDEAVRKLQIAAIYEKMHIERSALKKIFLSGKSNNEILDEQINFLKEEQKKIENLISVAEQLRFLGMNGEMMSYYASLDFAEITKNTALWKESKGMKLLEELLIKRNDDLEIEIESALSELVAIDDMQLENEEKLRLVEKIFTRAKSNLGFGGWIAITITAISANGGGIGIHEICSGYEDGTRIKSTETVMEYLKRDMNLLWDEYMKLLSEHNDAIGQEYSCIAVKELVDELKMLLFTHLGLNSKEEYEMFFEFIKFVLSVRRNKYLKYTLNIMEYYHQNT